jgi:hypothetical protein
METDKTPAAWTSLVLLERFRDGDDLAAGPIRKTLSCRSIGVSSSVRALAVLC